ncbi:MAG: prepilin-type N-terminal cleavage/methylation domain-containing protein [Elusimicrobiaceae bacterium]|nr:prepilin-type N-terminal cleavage/methylation domain-containing protein [Elusimicrobiaceae bacterium]
MRNNKGFTLMELVAAIFIGGMVTAALVLIWKTASTQTSQGQRQTIIRNQVSNFQRQLYRDFYAADMITYPNATNNGGSVLLAGLKKAKRINNTQFEVLRYAPQGPTKYFVYCYDNAVGVIRRLESNVPYDPDNPIANISDFGSGLLNSCQSDGIVVLYNFNLCSATLNVASDYIYN